MDKLIMYLTFLPWLLYYGLLIFNSLKSTKTIKFNFKWLKENASRILHFESLLLIAIFIYFTRYDNKTVNEMLFTVINLYLFVNTFYDKRSITKNKLDVKDISSILITIILSFAPLVYFIKTNNLVNTYYILFIYAFINYLIAILSRAIDNLLKKVFKNKK